MVLTLKAKEGLEHDNPFQVGQSGLIGNPAAAKAMDDCDVLVLVGTDFPYRDWYPTGKTVIQLDARGEHIGRRTAVAHALVGDAGPTLAAPCSRCSTGARTAAHLDAARDGVRRSGTSGQQRAARPGPRRDAARPGPRAVLDNPDERIRPEARGRSRRPARRRPTRSSPPTPACRRSWLSRFVTMRGTRRLVGSYNLGSMANAMPQALGAQALDRTRQVVAFCGDGGLMMLLGDLRTAVTYRLPVDVRRLRQRPARHGQARAGAGRAAGVRHRARQPRPRRRRRGHGADEPPRSPSPTTSTRRSPGRCRPTARHCSTS